MDWNLSEAKNRLSEVLTRADDEAQTIIRREREYVLINARQYQKLKGTEVSFTEFLTGNGPRSHQIKPMPRQAVPMREPRL